MGRKMTGKTFLYLFSWGKSPPRSSLKNRKIAVFKAYATPSTGARPCNAPDIVCNRKQLNKYTFFCALILQVLFLCQCTNPLLTVIEREVTEAIRGKSPQIELYQGGAFVPGSFDFGTVEIAGSKELTFVIRNNGNANLELTSSPRVRLQGKDAALYTLTQPGRYLFPGETTEFTLTFSPDSAGVKNAEIFIASNDPEIYALHLGISGCGVKTVFGIYDTSKTLLAAGDEVRFRETALPGSGEVRSFTLKNNSSDTLPRPSLTLAEGDTGDFVLTASLPASLEPGQEAAFTLEFTPAAIGCRRACIVVQSTSPAAGPFRFYAAGSAGNWNLIRMKTGPAAEGNGYHLGTAVDIEGDIAIAGSPYANSGAGDFTVFGRNKNGRDAWDAESGQIPSVVRDDDSFGCAVALDGNAALAGACFDDAGDGFIPNSGIAYLLVGGNFSNSWSWTASEPAVSNGEVHNYFGYALAADNNRFVVGAYNNGEYGQYSGAVYFYYRMPGGSAFHGGHKVVSLDIEEGDYFGYAVDLKDGYAIVGAPHECARNIFMAGSAYIFRWNTTTEKWEQQQKLMAPAEQGEQEWDLFGQAVALSGNYCIVGAEQDKAAGNTSGSAYIFKRTGEKWSQAARLTAPETSNDNYFGLAVAISDQYAVIGAPTNTNARGACTGAVYIFENRNDNWLLKDKLLPEMFGDRLNFGCAVAIDEDRIIIGADARSREESPYNAGAVYIYYCQ